MATEKWEMVAPSTEFRTYSDDAWYKVCVTMEGDETLRVHYENFSHNQDTLFLPSQFHSLDRLHDFQHRFRPESRQLQDAECRNLHPGTKVCASFEFSHDDLRFYDAVIHKVSRFTFIFPS